MKSINYTSIKCLLLVVVLSACFDNKSKKNLYNCTDLQTITDAYKGFSDDLEKAVQCAKKTDRPIFVVFTCWACIGDMDAIWEIFEMERVKKTIRKHFILVTLYMDDQAPLDKSYTDTILQEKRLIETVGDKNQAFQIKHFGNRHPPLYGIFDHQLQAVGPPIEYTPNGQEKAFVDFLQNGLQLYEAVK